MPLLRTLTTAAIVPAGIAIASPGASAAEADRPGPLAIQEQGSFAVGGTMRTEPGTLRSRRARPGRPNPSRRPRREVPAPMPSAAGPLKAAGIPMAEAVRLTRLPIAIYYGDTIPEAATPRSCTCRRSASRVTPTFPSRTRTAGGSPC